MFSERRLRKNKSLDTTDLQMETIALADLDMLSSFYKP